MAHITVKCIVVVVVVPLLLNILSTACNSSQTPMNNSVASIEDKACPLVHESGYMPIV